jgi:hypothetical protein
MQHRTTSFDNSHTALRDKVADSGSLKKTPGYSCYRCGQQHPNNPQTCKKCNADFWCEWDSQWYQGRLSKISLGQDPTARKLSIYFIAIFGTILLAAAATEYHAAFKDGDWARIIIPLIIGAHSIYEIWAFCHGRKTTIEHCTHTAVPRNTHIRTLGLILDFAVLALALYVF